MAETAFLTMYKREFILAFEQRQSIIREAVTTDTMTEGNVATFLVADSAGDEAVTRGVNGLIPARADNLTQPTLTLVEWHDLRRKTSFNIFAGQGDQRRIMQINSMAVVNRKIDSDIISVLDTASNNLGTAATASLAMVVKALTRLGNNFVVNDGNVWGVITPAFLGYLVQSTEFSSADYVRRKPLDGDAPGWTDAPGYYDWMNVKWIVHSNLTGVGTTSEKCYMFHKSAVGHAVNSGGMQALVGYDEQQDYSWARTSIFMGSKVLQQAGIIQMLHDGYDLSN